MITKHVILVIVDFVVGYSSNMISWNFLFIVLASIVFLGIHGKMGVETLCLLATNSTVNSRYNYTEGYKEKGNYKLTLVISLNKLPCLNLSFLWSINFPSKYMSNLCLWILSGYR